jgi:hypothetical protein
LCAGQPCRATSAIAAKYAEADPTKASGNALE